MRSNFALGLVVVLAFAAGVASAQTRCGAPATGLKADGSGESVTLSAEQARGQRVGASGVWEFCVATPNRACGQGGTGYMPGRGALALLPSEAGALRIDELGIWRECAACPPQSQGALRAWSEAGASCVALERDRVLLHGEIASWSQWTGASRGFLIEACTDGRRALRAATCAPARACDTEFSATRTNAGATETYSYDARGSAAVPLGTEVLLRAPSGKTWPARCVAGEFVAPASLPTKPAAPPPPKPAQEPGCNPAIFAARAGLAPLTHWRVTGARQPIGATAVAARVDKPSETLEAICGADGRWTLR